MFSFVDMNRKEKKKGREGEERKLGRWRKAFYSNMKAMF